MSWLQIGLSKSGNLWLYQILSLIAQHAQLPKRSFIESDPIHPIARNWKLAFPNQADIDTLVINPDQCLYRISNIYQMPIKSIDAYIQKSSHVWTHSPYNTNVDRIIPKFSKCIYIIRDPRDVALSLAKFNFSEYRMTHYGTQDQSQEQFLKNRIVDISHQWVDHVGHYLLHAKSLGVYFILFERLLHDFENELTRLLKYLNISLQKQILQSIQEAVTFKTMKEKNPEHLRKGAWGNWASGLDESLSSTVTRITNPLLKLLNYPLRSDQLARMQQENELPDLPKIVNESVVKNSIAKANRALLFSKAKKVLFAAGKF